MEIMVDLETLSRRKNAVILAIAAIKFNRKDKHEDLDIMEKFYMRVDKDSCIEYGLHVDQETVKWWKKQDKSIQEEIFGKPRDSLKTTLTNFSQWYGNCTGIWSHGASFDIPILEESYAACGMEVPWKYWDIKDTRTLYDIAGIKKTDLPTEKLHHPLYDCWRQIWGVKEGMKRIKLN